MTNYIMYFYHDSIDINPSLYCSFFFYSPRIYSQWLLILTMLEVIYDEFTEFSQFFQPPIIFPN